MKIEAFYRVELSEDEYNVLMDLLGRLSLDRIFQLKMTSNDDETLRNIYQKLSDSRFERMDDFNE